jgi:ATP-dependent helicase HrpA
MMRIDARRLRRTGNSEDQQRLADAAALKMTERSEIDVKLQYPEELPITSHRESIIDLIRQHRVIVVCGETGSGKSTQLPKFCLEAGLGRSGMIGHTQPRRLAARSIASRLAEETETTLGDVIGYQIRFGDQTSDRTLIKLMTDGILLAEIGSDRMLDAYDVIIIDEAHERSLNIDFLMGYLRDLLNRRTDLKVIITSATIDAERFAQHFGDGETAAPIVNVEGRGYPVEMRYLPWEDVVDDIERGYDISRHVIAGLENLSRSTSGDVLVFLPTERDIREVSHRVAGHYKRLGIGDRVDLLPLYSRLPTAQQQQIFSPSSGGRRRIIFATNVAESSLTVPGISAVIDTGTARISRYAARSRVQRLPIESISRAGADQRAGRCGRIGPGICVRLYSVADYSSRDAFTTPEIRRTNLASVVLQMKSLRLGEIESFPLIDPPRPEAVREGLRTLRELAAIDDHEQLTPLGRRLGRMPVDPRVGRILLAAEENGVLPEVLPIAAALEVPDPRDRPPEKRDAADQAHQRFADPQSDFLSLLRLWRHYESLSAELGRSRLEKSLKQSFLSHTRMREWADVYRQLRDAVKQSSPSKSKIGAIHYSDDESKIVDSDRDTLIHQSLLAGFLSGVAMIDDKSVYTGVGGLKLALWPGSGLSKTKPKWIVAAELVETTRAYARTVANIQPGWIESVGAHLLKKSHHDPHFSEKAGSAFCYENQTLFGLPIVVRRRVPLAPIDPVTARELLIDPGLSEDRLQTQARFVAHNQNLVQNIQSLAAKTRRRDYVIDSYKIAQFYQERLPDHVVDRARLEKYDREFPQPSWTKSFSTAAGVSSFLADPPPLPAGETTLYMRPDDLIPVESNVISDEEFPDELVIGASRFPLQYHFEPGGQRDGVNVRVHEAALAQISDARLGWLVPGLLTAKITMMIKSLPKRIRRNLVPAADVAAKIAEELKPDFGKIPFEIALCAAISRHAEMPVSMEDFTADKLDEHLQMLVSVVDDQGETIAEGRQVAPLVHQMGLTAGPVETTGVADGPREPWQRDAMTAFDIDRLPTEVIRVRGGVEVAQFPGLRIEIAGKDEFPKVSTAIYSDLATAERSLADGATSLFAMKLNRELRTQIRNLPTLAESKMKIAGLLGGDIERSLVRLLARIAMVEREKPLRTAEEFNRRLEEKGRRVHEGTVRLATWLRDLTTHGFAARSEIEALKRGKLAHVIADITTQHQRLVFDGWLDRVAWTWIEHYPRYLRAIAYRIEKLRAGSTSKDDEATQSLQTLWGQYLSILSESRRSPEETAADEVRWMLEEYRVSLFAQPLGTSQKVSPQRIEKLLAELRKSKGV